VRALGRRNVVLLAAIAAVTATAGVLRYAGAAAVPAFAVAGLALAGLAWVVSFATEQLGQRFGPAVTGFLQSTLGNLPEFFVVIFALSAGEVVVAQTSIIGSIFANALLVLGIVLVVGARAAPDGVMRFRGRLPADTATLLFLANFIIVLTGLSLASSDRASRHVETIDAVAAGAILVVYVTWVVRYLREERPPESEAGTAGAALPLAVTIGLLGASGVGAAFVSDWFVHALDPAVASLHISKAFAGLVIVAIAGNAVENVTGIVLAHKGKADLAISVVKNSVAQIAAFLFPALVLVSFGFDTHLTFALKGVYIGALFLTALAVWQITADGEALPFEGWALVALYVIIATFALYE
jgi:Ca2+:H+ antiporter